MKMLLKLQYKITLLALLGLFAAPHWQTGLSTQSNRTLARTKPRSLPARWPSPSEELSSVARLPECFGSSCQEDDLKHLETTVSSVANSSQNVIQNLSNTNPANSNSIAEPTNQPHRVSHCIGTPQNMSFCANNLNWSSTMGLPNLLAHKSEQELAKTLSAISISSLTSVRCKAAPQFKLLLCSTLSPACLDVALPPCFRLCMSAKMSCEPALRRRGLEWPDFLDCRRFPRSPEYCLDRQPSVIGTDGSPDHQNSALNRIHGRLDSSSAGSNSSNLTPSRRRKVRPKNRPWTRTTTTTAAPSSTVSITTTSIPETSTEKPVVSNDTSLLNPVNEKAATITEVQLSTTTEAPPQTTRKTHKKITTTPTPHTTSTSPASSDLVTSKLDLAETDSASTGTIVVTDYSSMPVNTTEDLTQLICSVSPDWLIKTKLSDTQLMGAAIKRKLKVRSYLQVFGLASNRDGQANSTAPRSSKSVSSNLYLSLSNSTLFVTAMGPQLYTQPLSDTLLKASESSMDSKSVRYYLVAGKGSTGTLKSASLFILWPSGSRFSFIDSDSQGSLNIIKSYREFKRGAAKVCERASSSSSDGAINPQVAVAHDTANAGHQATSQGGSSARKHKRKRVHNNND